jgi:hypothetical protein
MFQRYAADAERSYYRAWRELKAAKQLQNESSMAALRPTPPRMNVSATIERSGEKRSKWVVGQLENETDRTGVEESPIGLGPWKKM